MSTEKETVFLSGATGYIAQHIVRELLNTGKFKIIGSVRSEVKAKTLAENFGNNPDLSFVYVKEIADPTAFDEAFKTHGPEIDYVIHSASPITFHLEDVNKDLIIPAKNGAAGIFKAAAKYATNLKHFVVTSSYAAISDFSSEHDHSSILSEESWNQMPFEQAVTDNMLGYCYSKKVAEKAIWDLRKELEVSFNVTAVNPTFVFGPQCFDSSVSKELNVSCQFINSFVHLPFGEPVDDSITGCFIDVRDVAKVHVNAILDSKKFDGKRLLLDAGYFGNQSIVDVLNEIPSLKGKIAVGTPHRDDNLADEMIVIDSSKTKELLGLKYISFNKSVKDTALQIVKFDESLKSEA